MQERKVKENEPIDYNNEGVMDIHVHFNTITQMLVFNEELRKLFENKEYGMTHAEVSIGEVTNTHKTKMN